LCVLLSACGGGGGADASGNSPPPVTTQPNHVPVANAGDNQTVARSAQVTLDGSASSDVDGDSLAYHWVQTSGTPVTLSSTTAAKPTFTAPTQSDELAFSLVANDGKADSAAATVSVNVHNNAPVAEAVTKMSVNSGSMARLDGTNSTDPDGDPLTYTWTQIQGSPVTIQTIAPGVSQFQVPNTPTTLVFVLNVSDGEATSVTINITVNVIVVNPPATPVNHAPTVFAGSNQVVPKRSNVMLNGGAYDPDNDTNLTFTWEQTAGPAVTLQNANTATPTFTAPATPATLAFALRASDGQLSSDPSEVTVVVKNFAPSIASVAMTPTAAYTADNIKVSALVSDADNDPVTTKYEWRRNGAVVTSQTSSTFPANLTTKNDVITVKVTANDGTDSATVDASTTILDSPPVLTANPPTTLTYGSTASFTISASDADGDAIPGLEVAYGPAGFNVDSHGLVTWKADGPLFDKQTDFNWGIRIRGNDTSMLSGTIKVTDAARLYPIRRTGVQIPIQNNGLVVGDFDGDGKNEMLIGSSNAVYILRKLGASFQQSWVYPFDVTDDSSQNGSEPVYSVAAHDIDGDGKQEIFFSKGNVLVRLDGVNRREAARKPLRCLAMKLADVDRDGHMDLVCLASSGSYYGSLSKIVVLDPTTLAEKWSTPELNLGGTFAIGNVDHDAALEIVTAGGYVFDGQTHQNEWAYGQPFGSVVDVGDLDGDGVDDIVGMVDWSAVRVYSAVYKSPIWEYTPGWNDMDTLIVADADGDGKVEAIVGNGQWGEVFAIGYNTTLAGPELLWHIDSQNHGVTSIAVGDVDGDGVRDVVWGTGASSSGRDDLVVASFNPVIAIKWTSEDSPQLDGGFYGGALARIGGGASRLLFACPRTNSGYDGFRAIALDPATDTLSVSSEIGTNWANNHAFDIVDYDHDNVDEMFIGTAQTYNGYFTAYDFSADTAEWQSPSTDFQTAMAVTHADMNGDGYPDLIGVTMGNSSSSPGPYLSVYDVHAQTLIWKSTGLSGGAANVRVADLDHDGKPEIIVPGGTGLVIYAKAPSGSGYLQRASVTTSPVFDLLVADLDGDNVPEIYTLESDSSFSNTTLKRYDTQLKLVHSTPLGIQATSMFVEDSAFARKNLLISTSQGSYPTPTTNELWAVDAQSGAEVWRSPALPGPIPLNSLQYGDLHGNGKKAISFGASGGMFYTR
jgi:hypothetical protein